MTARRKLGKLALGGRALESPNDLKYITNT